MLYIDSLSILIYRKVVIPTDKTRAASAIIYLTAVKKRRAFSIVYARIVYRDDDRSEYMRERERISVIIII